VRRVKLRLFCDGKAVVTGIGASGRSLFDSTGAVVFCASNIGPHISKNPNANFEEERAHDRNDLCIGFSPLQDAAGTRRVPPASRIPGHGQAQGSPHNESNGTTRSRSNIHCGLQLYLDWTNGHYLGTRLC
jgi:hypothetical protein